MHHILRMIDDRESDIIIINLESVVEQVEFALQVLNFDKFRCIEQWSYYAQDEQVCLMHVRDVHSYLGHWILNNSIQYGPQV